MIDLAVSLPWWDSLDLVRKAHSDLEAAAIVGFVLLVAFDSAAHFLEKRTPDAARVMAGIGLVFFWIAVAAESFGYKYGQRNDELSEKVIVSLDTKARNAAGKADKAVMDSGTALSQAGAAEIKVWGIQQRLDRASSELSEIEDTVRKQEPRFRLLEAGKEDFTKALKPFAGQKILNVHAQCGGTGQSMEAFWFEQEILKLLGPNGARWDEHPRIWYNCLISPSGNWIWVSADADQKVKDAAEVLAKGLNKLNVTTLYSVSSSETRQMFRTAPELGGRDNPIEWASEDPSSVVFVTWENPLHSLSNWGVGKPPRSRR